MSSRSIVFAFAAVMVLGSPWALAADGKPLAAATAAPAASPAKTSPTPATPIDINSASRAQLKTLPGIGDGEADRIIAARPYPSKAKLGAEKIVSDETYLAIKGLIVAKQPAAAKSTGPTKVPARP